MKTMVMTFLGTCAWSYIYICFVSTLFFLNTQERFAKLCFLVIDTLIVWQLMPYLGDMTHHLIPQLGMDYARAWETFFVWFLSYKLFGSYYEIISKPTLSAEYGYTPLSNMVHSFVSWSLFWGVNLYLFTADWFLNLLTSSGHCSFTYLCEFTIPAVLIANLVGVVIPSRIITLLLDKVVFQSEKRETSKVSFSSMQLTVKYVLFFVSFFILLIILFNSFQFVWRSSEGDVFVKADYKNLAFGLVLPVLMSIIELKKNFSEALYHATQKQTKPLSLSEYSAKHTAAVSRRSLTQVPFSNETSVRANKAFSSSPVVREEAHPCHCDNGRMAHTSVRMPAFKADNLFLSVMLTAGRIFVVWVAVYFFFIGAIGTDKYQKMTQNSPILQYIQQTAQPFSSLVPEMKEKNVK